MKRSHLLLLLAIAALGLGLFSCLKHEDTLEEEDTPIALQHNQERVAIPPLKTPTSPRLVQPENPGPQGRVSEFQQVTQEALAQLPLTEDVRRRQHDPHFSPPELQAAAPVLGKIATSLRESPELIPQGIEFYNDCARSDGVLTAVRVLCLRNLRYWVKQQPDVRDVDPSDYPEEIWRLADSLPAVVK